MLGPLLFYEMISDSPEEAGAFGEMIVNNTTKLKKYKEVECHLFKDVYIEDSRGVHQIDHIFVLKTGVFVVETKIFTDNKKVIGNEDMPYWTGFSDTYQTQFYNPIWQNESHVKSVKYLLGDQFDIISLVVFAWNNKPKECKSENVLNYKEFIDYPLNYTPKKELTEEDIKHICDVLSENEKKKPELKKKHKEQLKELKNKNKN